MPSCVTRDSRSRTRPLLLLLQPSQLLQAWRRLHALLGLQPKQLLQVQRRHAPPLPLPLPGLHPSLLLLARRRHAPPLPPLQRH